MRILALVLIGVSGVSCSSLKKPLPEEPGAVLVSREEYVELVTLRETVKKCGDALFQFEFDEAFGNIVRVPSALPEGQEGGAQ
jgi:hypothetical protein